MDLFTPGCGRVLFYQTLTRVPDVIIIKKPPFGREQPITREDILEAAAQIVRQKGFHGASMEDIARAVNLQKPSLYHLVSSKQEILLVLLNRGLELLVKRISAICNQPIPADEKLQQMIRAYLQILAENTDRSAVPLF